MGIIGRHSRKCASAPASLLARPMEPPIRPVDRRGEATQQRGPSPQGLQEPAVPKQGDIATPGAVGSLNTCS
jgi:hypothetical protein